MLMMTTLNWQGLLVGLATFLIIGLCHPIVIKTEYYFGTRVWWVFLIVGLAAGAAALCVENAYVSSILGVTAFCFLWSITELFQQRERVRKGWFPANPKKAVSAENETKKEHSQKAKGGNNNKETGKAPIKA